MDKAAYLKVFCWGLSLVVSVLAVVAWGQSYQWQLTPLNIYILFPVLGLLAFSLMWTHYVAWTLRDMLGLAKDSLGRYFLWTSYAVLILLCLHPGLLIFQLFVDGRGLPPFSYERYVGPGLGWITLLGTVSLLVFLAFELHRVYGKKAWWHYVVDLSDAAMLAVIYHSFRLGSQLQTGWFRWVWWFYAATFIAILVRKYGLRAKKYLKKSP